MTGVVVVGAGPTALLLAGDLAADGVEVTVLERRREESPLTRAFAVHARTLEQLDAAAVRAVHTWLASQPIGWDNVALELRDKYFELKRLLEAQGDSLDTDATYDDGAAAGDARRGAVGGGSSWSDWLEEDD